MPPDLKQDVEDDDGKEVEEASIATAVEEIEKVDRRDNMKPDLPESAVKATETIQHITNSNPTTPTVHQTIMAGMEKFQTDGNADAFAMVMKYQLVKNDDPAYVDALVVMLTEELGVRAYSVYNNFAANYTDRGVHDLIKRGLIIRFELGFEKAIKRWKTQRASEPKKEVVEAKSDEPPTQFNQTRAQNKRRPQSNHSERRTLTQITSRNEGHGHTTHPHTHTSSNFSISRTATKPDSDEESYDDEPAAENNEAGLQNRCHS